MASILGHTSAEFAANAGAEGLALPAHDALAIYRRAFRHGEIDGMHAPPGHMLTPASVHAETGATKFTLRLSPDHPVESESVILTMKSRTGRQRMGLCVSSQVGCAMGCTFCETAQMGLLQNLTAEQIVAQWFTARFHFGVPVSNIVFMGMGEPMDNLDAVFQAIRVFADANGPAIAPSRITVSTVGRPEGMRRFMQFTRLPGLHNLRLAVSINAPNDEIRSRIMPINRAFPLADVMAAMLEFTATHGRRILIEYVLIPGVNDAPEHAGQLARYLLPLPCTVNLIPYNPRRNSPWPAPDEAAIDRFYRSLQSHGLRVTRRVTLGRSLMAACGQLGNEHIRRARKPARLPIAQ